MTEPAPFTPPTDAGGSEHADGPGILHGIDVGSRCPDCRRAWARLLGNREPLCILCEHQHWPWEGHHR